MGFVREYIDKWSTTEMDETFTQEEISICTELDMLLHLSIVRRGILPFIVFLVTIIQQSVIVD